MDGGVRARIEIASPEGCPVAAATDGTDASVDRVDRASAGIGGTVTEEFAIDAAVDPPVDATAVTTDGDETVYRFRRERAPPCACDMVEREGPPVADVTALEGRLRIAFRGETVDDVRGVVAALDDAYDGVRLLSLSRGGDEADDVVFVDRGRLTDKQREVLERAHELGYFEYPKGANASEVADDLGIARSTFAEHLAAAQSKLFDALLADRGE